MTPKKSRKVKRGGPGSRAVAIPAEDRLTFLIHRVNARIANTANRLLRANRIESFSARILVLLLEHGDMRVGGLVEALSLPQPTLSHQLQRLERRGLIKRRRVREDNRSVVVVLTANGRQVAEECEELSESVHRYMVEHLSPAQVAGMKEMLVQLADKLARYDEVADPAKARRRPK
jgi:DNA-binding MarR family transcriptional regulator